MLQNNHYTYILTIDLLLVLTRSLSSVLSDLSEKGPKPAVDFSAGMQMISNAMRSDVDDGGLSLEKVPMHHAASSTHRRLSSSASMRRHAALARSVSLPDDSPFNERQ
jgi:hypothetical protein